MSSRTESDDPWQRQGSRTADRGPRLVVRAAQQGTVGVTGSGGPAPEPPSPHANDGWRVFSYMIGGMVLYGGIGWLVGHWTGISLLFPLGMIFGIVLSVVGIIFRFSRS
jgi:ATP synthase protein I